MGVVGSLLVPAGSGHAELSLFSGELPYRDNKRNVSCIPSGVYTCQWNWSPRFNRLTYEILNVPGRTGIRFHPANFFGDVAKGFKSELNGCVALGERVGFDRGQRCLFLSRKAITRFEQRMGGKPFLLDIL